MQSEAVDVQSLAIAGRAQQASYKLHRKVSLCVRRLPPILILQIAARILSVYPGSPYLHVLAERKYRAHFYCSRNRSSVWVYLLTLAPMPLVAFGATRESRFQNPNIATYSRYKTRHRSLNDRMRNPRYPNIANRQQ